MPTIKFQAEGWMHGIGECGPKVRRKGALPGQSEEGILVKVSSGGSMFVPLGEADIGKVIESKAFNQTVRISIEIEVLGPPPARSVKSEVVP
jgi:hypothetical protein